MLSTSTESSGFFSAESYQGVNHAFYQMIIPQREPSLKTFKNRLPFLFLISGVMVVEIMTKVLNRTILKVKKYSNSCIHGPVVVPMLILRISSYAL